ncbi:hypothetical protein [uncultured Duncaniella sp.]|jgi:hypothetical protein|uniref:hypothetical protein n=1 Tax=uncultured Duncaniella sp. TaxID=2768039 RepID=UPI003220560A
MELSNAIKDIINRFGTKVLPTRQFVNLLDDVGGFKDEPAASKKVMKGLLDSGFGELLYRLSEKKDGNWQNSIRKSVGDYAAKSGYKDELINRIAAQLLYSVGLIDELPKIENSAKTKSTTPKQRIKDPKELLYALKQEYITTLSELLTITTDEYGHKYGYYSTEANTRLYVIDAKIRLIAKEVGDTNIDSWLKVEKSKVENKNRPTPAQLKQALDDLMSTLERDYKTLMEKGHIVEDDEFGLKSAKFAPNVVSDLRSVEKKIIIIGNKRKENRQSWIDKTKSDFLASKSSPASARNGVLDQLKNDYLSRLSELDRSTKSGEIDFSDSTLKDTRRKLINLGSLLGKNMEQWCNAENDKLSKDREVRASKRKKRNVVVSAVAGVALLIGGWQGISYTSSADARAAYETTMASAKAEYAQGNYTAALDLFQKAENDYDASYSSSSYKGEAHAKAVETSDKIIANWEEKVRPLLQSKKVAQAKALTLALPTNLVLDGNSEQVFKSISEQIDSDLATRTTEMVDELLNDIYTHQGKLSEAGKAELDEMIKVVPDNYWLNFIKEKAK